MKPKLISSILFSAMLLCTPAFAETENLSFSTVTDFAFSPKTDYVAGPTHFAPVTGFYGSIGARTTGKMDYTIPTPLGEHWLLSDATLVLDASTELSPVTIAPGLSATFTPVPFLVFEAGGKAGTGWNLAGIQGLASFDGKDSYTDLTPFASWLLKAYFQGTFQFDVGAVVPGDWTHLQMQYTYQLYYQMLSSAKNSDVWKWQAGANYANGLQNYQCIILAYQMPLVISRIGVMTEIEGHYNTSDFYNPAYKGDFNTVTISPLAQFTFGSHDVLSTVCSFATRRSFYEPHVSDAVEPNLTYAGTEWYLYRVALSWTHTF